jgi:NADPH2:quinone reductase
MKGAWVATTCSTRNIEYVKQFGADHIIDYTQQKWYSEPDWVSNVDAIIDTIGEKDGFARSKGVVKPEGAFVSIADQSVGFVPDAHPPMKYAAFHCLCNNPDVS